MQSSMIKYIHFFIRTIFIRICWVEEFIFWNVFVANVANNQVKTKEKRKWIKENLQNFMGESCSNISMKKTIPNTAKMALPLCCLYSVYKFLIYRNLFNGLSLRDLKIWPIWDSKVSYYVQFHPEKCLVWLILLGFAVISLPSCCAFPH